MVSPRRLVQAVELMEENNPDGISGSDSESADSDYIPSSSTSGCESEGEKQTVHYDKLSVPKSMRSVYWKCYGFPADDKGQILTRLKIVCTLCKGVLAYNRNTSNLRMHLQNKHFKYLQKLEDGAPPRKHIPKKKPKKNHVEVICSAELEGTIQLPVDDILNSNDSEVEYSESNRNCMRMEEEEMNNPEVTIMVDDSLGSAVTKSKVCTAVMDFIIIDLQLPDVVETVGFQRLIESLQYPCQIPSKMKLVHEIFPLLYKTYKDFLKDDIASNASVFSLGIDEWQSDNKETFVTFSVHFFHKNSEHELKCRVLSTVHSSLLSNSKRCSATIENLLQEFCINPDSIKAVISAADHITLISCLMDRGYTIVPCLISTFQRIFTTGCFSIPSVHSVLVKTRAFLGIIFRDSQVHAALKIQDNLLQFDETPLTSDYPNVWISTHSMLKQLLVRRSIIDNCIKNMNLSDEDKDLLTFTKEDWSIVEDVVHILEPFKVATMTLSEEKTPLLSLLSPLLKQLLDVQLNVEETDSDFAVSLKTTISTMLKDTYSEKSVDTLLKTTTMFDPRLKSLLNEEEKAVFDVNIKQELINYLDQKGPVSEDEPFVEKKLKLSGMEMLLGGICSKIHKVSNADRADIELSQFRNEAVADLELCPLSWWQEASVKYPNLSALAKAYNCITATVVSQSRIPVEKHVDFDMRRAKLPVELVDSILFLNSIYTH